jgi:hypothetical protein
LNTYGYVGGNPVSSSDPTGLVWYAKAVKWAVQGGKRIGAIPTGTIATKSAVLLRKAGKSCKVFAKSEEEALSRAIRIEKAAHPEGELLHHPKDAHSRNGNQPHIQIQGVPGHTFYTFFSLFAATTYLGDGILGQAVDFVNPLSLPKDVMDIYNDLSGSEEPCECS